MVSLRAELSQRSFAELGTAQQLALRVCAKTWPLTRAQSSKLHEFDERVRGERARGPALKA